MSFTPVDPQEQCTHPNCHGAKASGLSVCFVHASNDEASLAVTSANAGNGTIDMRGTPLSQEALERVLAASPTNIHGLPEITRLDLSGARPVEDISVTPVSVNSLKLDELESAHDLAFSSLSLEKVATMYNLSVADLQLTVTGGGKIVCDHARSEDSIRLTLDDFGGEITAATLYAPDMLIRLGASPKAVVAISPFVGSCTVASGSVGEMRIESGRIDSGLDFGGVKATVGISARETVCGSLSMDGCEAPIFDVQEAGIAGDLLLENTSVDRVVANGVDVRGDFMAVNTTFGSIECNNATLSTLDIGGCRLRGNVEIGSMTVGHLVLDGIAAEGEILLSELNALGHVSLRQAKVRGGLRWIGGVIGRSLSLDLVQVSQDLTMRDVAIDRILGLEHARIEGDVELASVSAGRAVAASGMRIGGNLVLGARAPEVDLRNVHVAGPARFELQSVELSLADAILGSRTDLLTRGFENNWACALDLRSIEPQGRILIDGSRSSSVIDLRGARCDDMKLQDVSLDRCLFETATGLDELRLTGEAFARKLSVAKPRVLGRRRVVLGRGRLVLAEDPDFETTSLVDSSGTMPASAASTFNGRTQGSEDAMAERYRRLRAGLEEGKDSAGASDFYFSEMEMRRRAARPRSFERGVLTAYRLTGGYGVRPLAPLVCLLALLVLATAAARVAGAVSTSPPAAQSIAIPPQRCDLSMALRSPLAEVRCRAATLEVTSAKAATEESLTENALTVSSAALGFTRTPDPRLDSFGQALVMVVRLVGALLLAFLLLGLRSVVRR